VGRAKKPPACRKAPYSHLYYSPYTWRLLPKDETTCITTSTISPSSYPLEPITARKSYYRTASPKSRSRLAAKGLP